MLKEKLQNIIKEKTEGDKKKNIENLVVFLILLIITVVAINVICGEKDTKNTNTTGYKEIADNISNNCNISESNEYDLQNKLEDILSKMQGVGKVKVLVTYSQTSSIIPMYNESGTTTITEETDSNGGTRKQESADTNKEVVKNADNQAITQTVTLPKIEGTIIIAEGGGNVTTKTNIIQAVSAVTGLASYKVQVFEMVN